MEKNTFNKWKKVAVILCVLLIIGYIIAYNIHSRELKPVIMLSLQLFAILAGMTIAYLGYDNRSSWMMWAFIIPQIVLPLMFFRNYKKVEQYSARKLWKTL